jgi:predicted GNAT family acetyltransferase
LEGAPYDNVYLQWLVESGSNRSGERIVVARAADGSLRGVAHDAPNIVFAGDGEAIDAFARSFMRRVALPRMIVAPRPLVERFWKQVRRHMPQPWAIRSSQPVYALEPQRLNAPPAAELDVARGTLAEADELVVHAARMAAGELGGQADNIDAGYRRRLEANIAAGGFWRARVDGRLVFQCYLGPKTQATAQLQGIWTPPEFRRRGYATRALGAVCQALLAEYPTLSLYVNDFNRSAIALYEGLGFSRAGEFASVIF